MIEEPLGDIPGPVATAKSRVVCDNITITAEDGRVFDLGKPDSKLFRLRVARYKWQRRSEIRASRRKDQDHG